MPGRRFSISHLNKLRNEFWEEIRRFGFWNFFRFLIGYCTFLHFTSIMELDFSFITRIIRFLKKPQYQCHSSRHRRVTFKNVRNFLKDFRWVQKCQDVPLPENEFVQVKKCQKMIQRKSKCQKNCQN